MVLVVEHVAVDDEFAGVVGEVAGDEERSPGSRRKVSFRQSSQGGGSRPLRESRYSRSGCMWITWETLVGFAISQVSAEPSFGPGVGAGRVEGAAVDQPGRLEDAPDRDLQVRSGVSEARFVQAGSGRSLRGTLVWSRRWRRRGTASAHRRRCERRAAPRRRAAGRSAARLSPAAAAKSTISSTRSPGSDQHVVAAHRPRHQAAVGADLDQRRAVGEVEVVGAEVRGVEDAQPVALGRDLVVGRWAPLTRTGGR